MNSTPPTGDGRMSEKDLIDKFKRMFKCDAARITRPMNRWFLIVGQTRSTRDKDYKGRWTKNGKSYHFEFTEERVVASGKNETELIQSAKNHKRLLKGRHVFSYTGV